MSVDAVMDAVEAALSGLTAGGVRFESDLQAAVGRALHEGGLYAHAEVPIGEGSRIDFTATTEEALTSGASIVVGVEVKKGRWRGAEVYRQLQRYAESPGLAGLILVAEQGVTYWARTVNGKPLRVVNLAARSGLAL